jgi:outer membrane protein TolC
MFSRLVHRIEAELSAMGGRGRFRFISKADWTGAWKPQQAQKALFRALDDPEPDVLLACGDLLLQAAAEPGAELHIPVLGLSFLPWKREALAQPGLNAVGPHGFFLRDLKRFQELTGASHISLLLDSGYLGSVQGLAGQVAGLERKIGLRLDPVGISDSPQGARPLQGEAVYVAPLPRLQEQGLGVLLEGLSSRQLPTFSCIGHPEVRLGALAGLCPDLLARMARRAALNLRQLRIGSAAEQLPGLEVFPGTLLLNGLTARNVGFEPGRDLLLQAELLHAEALEQGAAPPRELTLDQAMDLAAANSPAMEEQRAEVKKARHRAKRAGSALLPQIGGRVRYRQIDRDRAASSLGLFPRREAKAGLSLRQTIYNDPLISRYLASKHSSRAEEIRSAALQLDTRYRAGRRYLGYLEARAGHRIERDTLRVVREHRRLARIRRQVGLSGPEDVYRLEMRLAEQQEAVLEARTSREKARLALNRAIGLDQEAGWMVHDAAGLWAERLQDRWLGLLGSPARARQLQARAVRLSRARAPELRALDAAIEAASIELAQSRRQFYLPRFGLQVGYDYLLQRDEEAPDLAGAQAGPGRLSPSGLLSRVSSVVSSADEEEWAVALEMELPLFQGGSRAHELREAEGEILRLRARRRAVAQEVEQRVRSAAYAMQSSRPGIDLARTSAGYARKHLQLIEERYRQGKAGLLDLLDAQNAYRTQIEREALAGYAYLRDVLAFQRAIAALGSQQRKDGLQ